jgi:cardiolipin synthase
VRPLVVSKLNTVAQIVFACLILSALAFHWDIEPAIQVTMAVVAALTLLSVGFYLTEWVRHMNANGASH